MQDQLLLRRFLQIVQRIDVPMHSIAENFRMVFECSFPETLIHTVALARWTRPIQKSTETVFNGFFCGRSIIIGTGKETVETVPDLGMCAISPG